MARDEITGIVRKQTIALLARTRSGLSFGKIAFDGEREARHINDGKRRPERVKAGNAIERNERNRKAEIDRS